MTRVLVWKEFREQWTSAVAITVVGMIFLASARTWDDGSQRAEVVSVVLVCMTWIGGLVAGIQPLASERESGMLTGWMLCRSPAAGFGARKLWAPAGSRWA
ncbi:MAG TPA: hypothetical protein VH120_05930 [Gemmataceae bacterium]|jgi:hypothetical protein|nr:hypothetical protein [Gemmataceae bacterium]